MKAIQIKSLTLRNWRGEKESTTVFHTDGTPTTICGRNGIGKSRHMDAFCWLLFGKDSKDRKDFNLRTVDANGEPLHHCECSVGATLLIDGTPLTLKREYKESWVKPRGQVEEVFKGNVTECTWDGVPVRVKDYAERINREVIDETVFKMLTNTEYFLSLKQDLQRETLLNLAGIKSDTELAAGNADFLNLLDILSGKSLADFRKQLAAEKKRLKAAADEIKPRIDQTDRMKPEVLDWAMLEEMLKGKQEELDEIDEQLHCSDSRVKQENARRSNLRIQRSAIARKKMEVVEAENDRRKSEADKANLRRNEIDAKLKSEHSVRSTLLIDIKRITERIAALETNITDANARLEKLRGEWRTIKAKEYNGSDTCPHCGQLLPEDMRNEARRLFEEHRKKELKANCAKGKELAAQLKSYQQEIESLRSSLEESNSKLKATDERIASLYDELKAAPLVRPEAVNPANLPQYVEYQKQIDDIDKELATPVEAATDNDLIERRRGVCADMDEIKKNLNNREAIAKADKEIERLTAEGKDLAEKIAQIEKQEYVAAQFSKARIDDCECRLNTLFTMVQWKLFDTTLDGNEYEVCIPMVDGVPYGTCNTAKQINAAIDISNTLARHYEVYAPMFIDRAESVNKFIPSNAQMIYLRVTEDSQLNIK